MSQLRNHFEQISADIHEVLEKTESMKHPLIELIRYTTSEQKEALDHLLPILQQSGTETAEANEPDLEDIKPDIAKIYQNNEVTESTVRAWVRAVHWIPSFETQYTEEISTLFQNIREQLNQAADKIKQQYGAAEVKFLIPSFYLEVAQ